MSDPTAASVAASIKVDTELLVSSAQLIGAAAGHAKDALDDIGGASCERPFETGPMAQAYSDMLGRALKAFGEIEDTTEALARNVLAAGLGYLHTDQAIVPTSILGPDV